VLIFEVKPAFITCDNMAKLGSLDSLHGAKKLIAFCDPHLPQVVCQLVWDPAEMTIFISGELCKRFKTAASDTSGASASKYADKNGSLSKHAIILVSI
jgi:hypothetical protein